MPRPAEILASIRDQLRGSKSVALGQFPGLRGSTNIRLVSRALCNLTNIIGQRPRLVTWPATSAPRIHTALHVPALKTCGQQAEEHGLAFARQAEEHHRVEEERERKSRKIPSQAQKHPG